MARGGKPNPGWLQLQRERFGPDYQPPPARRECRAGELIPEVLKHLGLESQSRVADITAAWPDIAGEANAKQCRPGRWERGVLIIYVDHHLWLNELKRFASASLLKRLQHRFGKKAVRQLRFEITPDD